MLKLEHLHHGREGPQEGIVSTCKLRSPFISAFVCYSEATSAKASNCQGPPNALDLGEGDPENGSIVASSTAGNIIFTNL
jgi:hypothetical protein